VIFAGEIKQVRKGRINATDTYFDILAADNDLGYNQGVIKQTLAKDWTSRDVLDNAVVAMGVTPGYIDTMTAGAASRGKVQYGMARDQIRNLARSQQFSWSVQDGKLQTVRNTSYIPGAVVRLNAQSGAVIVPEQTQGGITVRCLLNPALRVGGALQINNASIQRAFLGQEYLYLEGRIRQDILDAELPKISNDGLYRIYVLDYSGDTRGQEWYANIVCMAIDKSAPIASSVKAAATQ
jgi:hypothetical protein